MAFAPSDMKIRSSAFGYHAAIPTRHAGDGENLSPPLHWEGVPEGTRSFALFCHDPDAPPVKNGAYGFVHWIVHGLPGDLRELPEGAQVGTQGLADHGGEGYTGPMPPEGHGKHHYYFWLLALDADLTLPAGIDLPTLLREVEPHLLGMSRLVGTYARD